MQAPGKIVKVNDTYMHVYHIPQQTADHKNTIVFYQVLVQNVQLMILNRCGTYWQGESIWW